MTIQITPIPKLTEFATPDLTLTTANAAGSAGVKTTIRSDASILTYDAVAPTTISSGASPAAGDTATAARRNHTHGAPAIVSTQYVGAFCGFSGTGSIISGSHNVTSVARTSNPGVFLITIATDFGDAYWAPLFVTEAAADIICSVGTPAAGTVSVSVFSGGSLSNTACRFAGIGTPA
jgi:hypothetical protein